MITQWKIQPLNANNILFNTFFPEAGFWGWQRHCRQRRLELHYWVQPPSHSLTLHTGYKATWKGLLSFLIQNGFSFKTSFLFLSALVIGLQPNIYAPCECEARDILSAKLF